MKHNKCLIQWPECMSSVNLLLREVSNETPSVFHFCTNELQASEIEIFISSLIFHFLNAAPAYEKSHV
jgi:hypothetical protein